MEDPQATEDAAAARAAEQARLRKERREAKIKAGGAARLNKITGLGGGVQRDPLPQPPSETSTQATNISSPATSATPAPAADQHADPEEVDISEHYYAPQTTARAPPSDARSDVSEARLRQVMLGLDRTSAAGPAPPPMPGMEGMEEDPMMKMLSQLMSGAGGGIPGAGGPGAGNPFAGTGMESLFGGLSGLGGNNGDPMQQAQQVAADKTANLWRILHAVFALGLGLYVALSTTFTGTLTEREHSTLTTPGERDGAEVDSVERARAYFFYVFTSVEALLLTARYFLEDRGHNVQPKGWMWTVSGFLPQPARGYAQHALRYGRILSTVRSDALRYEDLVMMELKR
ncbi:hypothetical protein AAE478_005934 [Parahypoxylon ruwenzoriense]